MRQTQGFPPGFKTEEVLVTPEMAQRYLDTMHANRTVSRIEVGVHEQNLESGNWYPEISPVYLDGGDLSWDAQHRLKAIVNTGIAAWMLFVRGVREEAAEHVDTGRRRSYADMLRIKDVPDYKRQSVLAKYAALYDMYGIDGVRYPSRHAVSADAKNAYLNTDAVIASIHMGEALRRAVGANPSWAAYAVWRTGTGKDGRWEPSPFWEQVRAHEHLVRNQPAYALVTWFMNGQKRDRRPADRRLMENYAYATSYNKFVTGQEYQRVNPVFEYRTDGSRFFPASNVPDFLPADIGELSRSQLRTAYANMERGVPADATIMRPAQRRTRAAEGGQEDD
jgi:hypothetical protein